MTATITRHHRSAGHRRTAFAPDEALIALRAGLATLLLVIAGLQGEAIAETLLRGPVTHVRDGDTIEVAGTPVRLQGLHAPERGTAPGERAAAWMRAHVLGRHVTCRLTGETSYDRALGLCRAGGTDLAAALVAAGLGRDCPRYSGGRYAALETPQGRTLVLPAYCRPR